MDYNQITNLPNLGQGHSDFRSLNDVLSEAAAFDTGVSRFAHANIDELRDLGHDKAAVKYNVGQTHAKKELKVEVFDWTFAARFAHLFLPCAKQT